MAQVYISNKCQMPLCGKMASFCNCGIYEKKNLQGHYRGVLKLLNIDIYFCRTLAESACGVQEIGALKGTCDVSHSSVC